jgi:RNA polymerase sigma factor (sigma-70 family)
VPDQLAKARLSDIATTHWTEIFRAQGQGDQAQQARGALLVHYYDAIYGYLNAKLPNDPHAADDIFSRFAEALLSGATFLLKAGQKPGRFRYYLKRIHSNMIADYYRARARDPRPLPELDGPDPVASDPSPEPEDEITRQWRQAVLNHAWRALEELERQSGTPYHTVCLCHASHPELRSKQKAEEVSKQLGRPVSADNFRQLVCRGSEKLADLILREVAGYVRTLEEGDVPIERIEEELVNLQLLDAHLRDALERYTRQE